MTSRNRDAGRKYVCGYEKLKKKRKREEIEDRQRNSLAKFLITENVKKTEPISTLIENQNQDHQDINPCFTEEESVYKETEDNNEAAENLQKKKNLPVLNKDEDEFFQGSQLQTQEHEGRRDENINDPGTWPDVITDKFRMVIIENGVIQVKDYDFPKDRNNRSFSESYYLRKLKNGDRQERKWLLYSKCKDAAFCYACKLFSSNSTSLSLTGLNDWVHLSSRLQSHERSDHHLQAMYKLLQLEKNMKLESTIDKEQEKIIKNEMVRLKYVCERIVAAILYLSEHNLAFRGSNDRLHKPQNGNFLGLIELIAKFDPILKQHLDRCAESPSRSYLSHRIQDELISALAKKVRKEIINLVKKAKYFTILLDCTPDLSHQEQLSVVLRFVNVNENEVSIQERFICFEAVTDSTGKGLSDRIESLLKEEELDLGNCRGQGYDNGANMRGLFKGVQAIILKKNSKAHYIPCGGHNLNLVLGDISKSSSLAISFFGTLQRLYTLFASSVTRWNILKENVKDLTPKPLSDTRWECRIDSVKSVRYQAPQFSLALKCLYDQTSDMKTKSEIHSIENKLTSFEFLVSLVIWYDILFEVNIVSKIFQNSSIDIGAANAHLKGLLKFFENYRETGFISSVINAKEIAEELKVIPEFKKQRVGRKTKQFAYEGNDQPISSGKEYFRVQYFLAIIDNAIISFKKRFEIYHEHEMLYGFLYNSDNFQNLTEDNLLRCCKDLNPTLQDDIDCIDLFDEIKVCRRILPPKITILDIFKYLFANNLIELYPNFITVLKIILTLPISVASAERSFSRLKLIKNYLRCSISQERFNALSILSIESELAKKLNYDDIIHEFAVKHVRK